jgi:hypothetical protein
LCVRCDGRHLGHGHIVLVIDRDRKGGHSQRPPCSGTTSNSRGKCSPGVRAPSTPRKGTIAAWEPPASARWQLPPLLLSVTGQGGSGAVGRHRRFDQPRNRGFQLAEAIGTAFRSRDPLGSQPYSPTPAFFAKPTCIVNCWQVRPCQSEAVMG